MEKNRERSRFDRASEFTKIEIYHDKIEKNREQSQFHRTFKFTKTEIYQDKIEKNRAILKNDLDSIENDTDSSQ